MTLSWKYHKDVEARLAVLINERPRATAQQLADILNAEFGLELTDNQVQKRRQVMAIANRPRAAVELVEQVESASSGSVLPSDFVPRAVQVTEMERDEEGNARKVSVTYAHKPTLQAPEDLGPVIAWKGGELSKLIARNAGETVTVVAGDTQFPHEDPIAWGLFLDFLRSVRPDRIVLSGDIVDFGKSSRHAVKLDRELIGGLNSDLNYAYTRLRELRAAAGEDAQILYVMGNHDCNWERTLARLGGFQSDLATLREAGDETAPKLLSIERMLRLESLGIETSGICWPDDRAILAPDLVVFHGDSARKGAGQSVKSLLAKYPMASTIQGHCHRQAIIGEAIHGIDGSYRIRYGIETGALCKTDGLGYTTAPDWQQGWAVISFGPDGDWTPEIVTINGGKTSWRGKHWTATEEMLERVRENS